MTSTSRNDAGAVQRGPRRKIISGTLVVLALAYLVYVSIPNARDVESLVSQVGMTQLALAILVATPMFLLKALYHTDLLHRMGGPRSASAPVLASYLQAQLVRYLPGKVWGLIYQAQRLNDSHSSAQVILANLSQMLMTNILSAGLIASVLLAAWVQSAWPLWGLLLTIALVEGLHTHPQIEQRAIERMTRALPRRFCAKWPSCTVPSRFVATGILVLEWVFYFWMVVTLLHGVMRMDDALLLGVWYAGASLISLAAFVVPAGIVVREAIFVSGAALLPGNPAMLVGIAALMRLCTVGSELMVAVLATISLGNRGRAE